MELFTVFLSLFSAAIVPLGLIATVQYCAYFNIEMDFKKLIIFSWALALVCIPFSFGFFTTAIYSMFSGEIGSSFLTVSIVYMAFGWLVCSAIYGKPIVPKFSDGDIKLP